MKIALIHYWLVNNRGGEKVLAELAELYPEADLFTHVYDPDAMPESIRKLKIKTTLVQKLPLAKKCYQSYLPLMPWALHRLDLSEYDLIISSESGPAKGIRKPQGAVHLCYCHTPMRYLWDLADEYYEDASFLKKIGIKLFSPSLRIWDVRSSQQVDRFIANSQFVADRIQRIYHRDATVIYPPVDTEHFASLKRDPQDFYLFFGQLTAYKRAGLAVQAFTQSGKRLLIAGAGDGFVLSSGGPSGGGANKTFRRKRESLRDSAGSSVEFMGRVSDAQRDELYSRAKALIFPGIEDFGMIPVEAQAAGCPVIAYRGGGALETVVENETGIFFDEQTVESLCDAVRRFEATELSEEACRKNARRFSRKRFSDEIQCFISQIKTD